MAKLIRLIGVKEEQLVVNTVAILGVKDINDPTIPEGERARIFELDPEIKAMFLYADSIHPSATLTRATVDEIIAAVNG